MRGDREIPALPLREEGYLAIAEQFGTPTFVLDLARLDSNYEAFRRAFDLAQLEMKVLYSVKTNYLPIVLTRLKALGCGVDVVSGLELELVARLGFAPGEIVFNGPHKTDDELAWAVERGIFVNIDAIAEVPRLETLARRMGRRIDVGLRVNPGVAVYRSADPTYNAQAQTAARQSKFGFSIADGEAAAQAGRIARSADLRVTGIHCHLGSQITDDDALGAAVDQVLGFAAALRPSCPVARVNIGGGFGVAGIRRERRGPLRQLLAFHGRDALAEQSEALDLAKVGNSIRDSLRRHALEDVGLSCEPGRAIVSDAMTLLSRVSSVKRTGGIDWVILDAGLNLMPTIAMDEDHRIVSLTKREQPSRAFRVGGPLCYEGDVLSRQTLLPSSIAEGDLVLIGDAGAYTTSRATSFMRPRAAVVSVADGTVELCWRRETFSDVFAFNVAHPF
jgi:diaminopimelate decarboxylase